MRKYCQDLLLLILVFLLSSLFCKSVLVLGSLLGVSVLEVICPFVTFPCKLLLNLQMNSTRTSVWESSCTLDKCTIYIYNPDLSHFDSQLVLSPNTVPGFLLNQYTFHLWSHPKASARLTPGVWDQIFRHLKDSSEVIKTIYTLNSYWVSQIGELKILYSLH